jgi:hypothetical protein
MDETSCRIAISLSPRNETRDLSSVLADEVGKTPPLLAWAEPDLTAVCLNNRTGRRTDFQALVCGEPQWPGDIRIVEARLFWKDASLHVVANQDGQGCRWVRIEEVENGEEGVESLQRSPSSSGHAEIEQQGGEMDVKRLKYPVFTVRDRQRFGLGEVGRNLSAIENVVAIEYRIYGHLIGWRLAKGNV